MTLSELIQQIGPEYQTLAQSALWQGELTQVDLENLVLDMWPALQALHDQNLVYGVFSLDTILLDRAQRAHLLSLSEDQLKQFQANNEFTAGYAAFEQHAADPGWPIGPWTDVYGLGMVLRSLILKQAPVSAMERVVKDDLAPLSGQVKGGFARRFLRAIDCATLLEPEVRTRSLNELVVAMGLAEASEIRLSHPEKSVPVAVVPVATALPTLAAAAPAMPTIPVSPATPSPVASKSVETTAASTKQENEEQPASQMAWKERKRGPALSLAALVLAGVAAGVYFYVGQNEKQPVIASTSEKMVATKTGNKIPAPLWKTQEEAAAQAIAQAETMANTIAGTVSETLDKTVNNTVNESVNKTVNDAINSALAVNTSDTVQAVSESAQAAQGIISDVSNNSQPIAGITWQPSSRAQETNSGIPAAVNVQEVPVTLVAQPALEAIERTSIDGREQGSSAAGAALDEIEVPPQRDALTLAQQEQAQNQQAELLAQKEQEERERLERERIEKEQLELALQEQKRLEAEKLAQEQRQKEQERASLAVVSFSIQPWGDVYVDGRRRGASPPLRSLRLSPGTHTIEIRNGNLPSHIVTVELESQQKATVSHRF